MATDSSIFSLGSSLQNYNPITSWFRSMMGQFGFVNINEMHTDDPDLEQGIVNGVASYGMQLGRVVEALQVVCEHLHTEGWAQDKQEALKSFLRLADEIYAFKNAHQPVRKEAIDRLIAELHKLREQDRVNFDRVRKELQ